MHNLNFINKKATWGLILHTVRIVESPKNTKNVHHMFYKPFLTILKFLEERATMEAYKIIFKNL